jgi:DivIVA domain-containing protein
MRHVIILLVVVLVLLAGLAVAVALGRVPTEAVLPPVTSESFRGLPRGGVDPEDLDDLRFDQVLRGYRMGQVDEVLERLRDELASRDAEIARLRGDDDSLRGDDEPLRRDDDALLVGDEARPHDEVADGDG